MGRGHCCHHYAPTPTQAQLPPLDPPEATNNVEWLKQIKLPMQWRGYKPTTLSSEEMYAYTQPLLVKRLNLSSQLIHAMMGI